MARPRSGHVYFTLKDDSASIRAVMWKNDARRLAFDLTDGLAVRALGTPDGLPAARRISDRRPRDRARGDRSARAGVSPAVRQDWRWKVCSTRRGSGRCRVFRGGS